MPQNKTPPYIYSDAVISPDGKYRYLLYRIWDASKPVLVFIGLNPSTADVKADDPTIRRCVGFAVRENCGGIVMLNLFAYRATDPKELPLIGAAGNDNIVALKNYTGDTIYALTPDLLKLSVHAVVAAWGAHTRARTAAANYGLGKRRPLVCLGTTQDGSPRHPLYVKSDAPLVPWSPQ